MATTSINWRLSLIEDELKRWTTEDICRQSIDSAAVVNAETGTGSKPTPKPSNDAENERITADRCSREETVKPKVRAPPPPRPPPLVANDSKKSAVVRFFTNKYDKPCTEKLSQQSSLPTSVSGQTISPTFDAANSPSVGGSLASVTGCLAADDGKRLSVETTSGMLPFDGSSGGGLKKLENQANVSPAAVATSRPVPCPLVPTPKPQIRTDKPVARIAPATSLTRRPEMPDAPKTERPISSVFSSAKTVTSPAQSIDSELRSDSPPTVTYPCIKQSAIIKSVAGRPRPPVPNKPVILSKRTEHRELPVKPDCHNQSANGCTGLPESGNPAKSSTQRNRVSSNSSSDGRQSHRPKDDVISGKTASCRRQSAASSNVDDSDDYDGWSASSWCSESENDTGSCFAGGGAEVRRDSTFVADGECRRTAELAGNRRLRFPKPFGFVSTPLSAADRSPRADATPNCSQPTETIVVTRTSRRLPKSLSLFQETPPTTANSPVEQNSPTSPSVAPVADENGNSTIGVSVVAPSTDANDRQIRIGADMKSGFSDDGQTASGRERPAEALPRSSSGADVFLRVELFYRSRAARVFVARSLARLFVGRSRVVGLPGANSSVGHRRASSDGGGCRATSDDPDWTLIATGVPVFLLDTGEGRRRRRLSVLLADRLAGFVKWSQTVDHLTEYRSASVVENNNATAQQQLSQSRIAINWDSSLTESSTPICRPPPTTPAAALRHWHTMRLSTDHTRLAAFHFDDPRAADDFLDVLVSLTSDPDDPLLDVSRRRQRKKRAGGVADSPRAKNKTKPVPVTKASISGPCCFDHVTRLLREDALKLIMEADGGGDAIESKSHA